MKSLTRYLVPVCWLLVLLTTSVAADVVEDLVFETKAVSADQSQPSPVSDDIPEDTTLVSSPNRCHNGAQWSLPKVFTPIPSGHGIMQIGFQLRLPPALIARPSKIPSLVLPPLRN